MSLPPPFYLSPLLTYLLVIVNRTSFLSFVLTHIPQFFPSIFFQNFDREIVVTRLAAGGGPTDRFRDLHAASSAFFASAGVSTRLSCFIISDTCFGYNSSRSILDSLHARACVYKYLLILIETIEF